MADGKYKCLCDMTRHEMVKYQIAKNLIKSVRASEWYRDTVSRQLSRLRGVNGVVVGPWAQNRKIKSSSIAGALLIPHTC